jgi:hypothetical protein
MFKNTPLYQSLLRVSRMNAATTFDLVFDTPHVKGIVIQMNTEMQLYQKGIDSEGESLESIGGDYSNVTKDIKSRNNQIYDHITLKDTGDFYKSWRVYVANNTIVIQADTVKDGDDLRARWGQNILGLTDESLGKLINYGRIKYREQFLLQWQN